jgi:hypothetical protein
MTIYCYRTAIALRHATADEIARYEALLAAMPSSQRDAGAVDGAEFGLNGITIYID